MDQRGRKIELNHTIFIIEGLNDKARLGFTNINTDKSIFDEDIKGKYDTIPLNNYYSDALRRYSYEISFDFDIDSSNKNKVNSYLYSFLKNNKKGKYLIHRDEIDFKDKIALKKE